MQSSNEKLRDALEECLEKDLSFVPKDIEIKKIYTPSDRFKKYMRKIIRKEEMKDKFKIIVTNKRKLYYFAVAMVILFFSIRIGFNTLSPDTKSNEMAVPQFESEESKSTESTESAEDSMYDSANTDQSTATTQDLVDDTWAISFVSDKDVSFQLANTTEQPYSYSDISLIEKLEGDSVTTVYTKEDLEQYNLSPMSTLEETIQFADYNMKESGSYRLYRTINENQVMIELEVK